MFGGLGADQLPGGAGHFIEPGPALPPTERLGAMPLPRSPGDLSSFDQMRADIDALAENDPEGTAEYLRALMTATESA
jgi:hypothetical protein